jgi:hypothetical protein
MKRHRDIEGNNDTQAVREREIGGRRQTDRERWRDRGRHVKR